MGRSGSCSRKDADHFGAKRVAWRKDGVIVAAPADHASYAGSHCCSGAKWKEREGWGTKSIASPGSQSCGVCGVLGV